MAPKILRRPKRPKTYGDGTELDSIEDLPTDRDKEVRYRIQPKGFSNRIPGAAFPSRVGDKDKSTDKGTMRKKSNKREGTNNGKLYFPILNLLVITKCHRNSIYTGTFGKLFATDNDAH